MLDILKANLVDIHHRSIHPVKITIVDGKIASIEKIEESFKLYPPWFYRRTYPSLLHGTVATVLWIPTDKKTV